MSTSPQIRRPGLWLALVGAVAASAAVWLFPRAMPTLSLGQHMSRQAALARADSFFTAHELAPDSARRAVRFQGYDSLQTFVDLAGGGRDTLNALASGKDVALFTWRVRAFVPGDIHEARVSFALDGRVVAFHRVLPETEARPEVTAEVGQAMAQDVIGTWLREDTTQWRLVTSSYKTQHASGRVDRTYTFERKDRRIADAPIRMDVVVAGDLPAAAVPYVVIPESFRRRYGEMRSSNDLIAMVAQIGMVLFLILGAVVLRQYAPERSVRWLPALLLGGVIGTLIVAAGLNGLPGSWFSYDTATSPGTFRAMGIALAVLSGAGVALLVGLTLAAAEAAARHAFPRHLDWWKLWRYRGTREVAGRVASGYVVALVAFAYVSLFYLVTRSVLGWWVPSELLDDPNLIATPMPWLSAVATALQAGVWEEALFRALPLSLLALWARNRPHYKGWMVAGVVGTALIFGFAHSNYASWPPYSRGVEIFLDACFWAVLFVWLGLVVTVIAHFTYDLVLIGLFAASGSALAYRVTAAVVFLIVLAPALAVAWRWLRRRGLEALPDEGRFGTWRPLPPSAVSAPVARTQSGALTGEARKAALVVGGLAVLLVIFLPGGGWLGKPFTVGRAQALATADSVAEELGLNPTQWTRLANTAQDPGAGALTRYLEQEHAQALAPELATGYEPPAWWVVRYVDTGGTVADRAEEWRIRLWPDGSRLDTHHIVPDSLPGDTVSDAEARRLARAAIASAGVDTLALQESNLETVERPARRDATVTYTDTTMKLPGDAAARVEVTLAGGQPLVVRRSVELPEAFRREQRKRGSTDVVWLILSGAWMLTLLAVGVVWVIRRRPLALDDGALKRKPAVAVVGVLTLFAMAASLNDVPARLFAYPTSQPWSIWLGGNAVAVLLSGILALVAYGLWLLLSALRRRVGIRLLPPGDGREVRRDVLLAGIGLGALVVVAGLGLRLANRGDVAQPPGTILSQGVPLLTGAIAVPLDVVMTVTILGIPLLAVAGIARRWSLRALAAALLVAPMMVLLWTMAPAAANPAVRAVVPTVVGMVAVVLAVRWWAPYSGWSWVVAAIVDAGLSGLWSATHSVTWVERGSGVLTLATALGLLVLAMRVVGPWRSAFAGPSSAREPGDGGGVLGTPGATDGSVGAVGTAPATS
ncbi:MAG: CPBP family intramembrane metalloprotease [Gemmatimonadetes bacterium]|nr:CPBP family intramembrane metalloprotease [Gemmatimonadota bacterium]